MEILIGASLMAAFIAGTAALFAPCCITVLLPTYLASVFRERKAVFLMTFVFLLGLLVVFLPLGLGVAGLGQLFSQYHNLIFIIGSLFLLFLGISLLMGKHFSLPFSVHTNMPVQNATSVFGLGIFSGFATLCCAPVLAGVLALSMLPGSIFWGGMYALVYVIGMTLPLFFLASFLDKTNIMSKLGILKKRFAYAIAGNKVNLSVADMIAGITFLAMGTIIFYLAQTNQLISHSPAQLSINIFMAKLNTITANFAGRVPAFLWVLLFAIIFGIIVGIANQKLKQTEGLKKW